MLDCVSVFFFCSAKITKAIMREIKDIAVKVCAHEYVVNDKDRLANENLDEVD